MSGNNPGEATSFWDHLDELRSSLLRAVLAVVLFGVIAFLFKDELFAIVLAPKDSHFVTYRLFSQLSHFLSLPDGGVEVFSVKLINTHLAQQFIIHVKMAVYAGVLLTSPYILYELFRFVSPALYTTERKYAFRALGGAYAMFMIGVALSYFLIFPLTFRFLGGYQVSSVVENQIVLESYIDTMVMLGLMMGIVFEMPILSWVFAKLGFISAPFLRKYRKHAIVILLTISAIITPTSDIVTLLLVSIPMYVLYEVSILIVANSSKAPDGGR